MLVLVIVAVALTGNSKTDEKSNLGKIVVDSSATNVFVVPANITFQIPMSSSRFFGDTKVKTVARYLENEGAVFGAELAGGEYEMQVQVEQFSDGEQSEEGLKNAYIQYVCQSNEAYEIKDYAWAEPVNLSDVSFLHSYVCRYDVNYREYNLLSDYIGVVDNKTIMVRFLSFSKDPFQVEEGYELLDAHVMNIITSISYGDQTPKANGAEDGFLGAFLKYSFSLWILLIPLFYILFSNMTYAKNYGEWQENALSRDHSKEILGFFAVLIVLHHLVQKVGVENAGIIAFLENMGVCFVGGYFFFSGYGLMKSYHGKKDYLKDFWKKRLPVVLVPFYVCIIIFVLWDLLVQGNTFSTKTILQLLGFVLINDHMWYIVEIVILYSAFAILFRICKQEKSAYIGMLVVNIILIAAGILMGHGSFWFQGEWWYNTTLLFWIGMLFEKRENKILAFVRKNYSKVVVFAVIIFFLLYQATDWMLMHYGYWTEFDGRKIWVSSLDKLVTFSVQLPMVISFTMVILIAGQKIRCSNTVLKFFGSISLELYLIHNLFLQNLSFVSGAGVYCFLVIVFSLLSAAVLHYIDQLILCKIYRKPLPKQKATSSMIKEGFVFLWRNITNSVWFFCKHPLRIINRSVREIVCIGLAIMSIYPIYIMMIGATQERKMYGAKWIPGKYFLENMQAVNMSFHGPGGSVYQGIINSCIIAFFTAIFATYLAALTAYAFERYNFKGKRVLWGAVIACMLVPGVAGFTGLYQMIVKVHMLNNLIPVILLGSANPAAVYFIRMYLKNISLNEIGEAARIDGASELRVFNQIILPLIQPVLALQLTFSFVAAWNNGFAQTLLLMHWDKKTIPAYMRLIVGDHGGSPDPQSYALMLSATLAPLIVYVLCSKSIVSSITLGGVKE